MPMTQKKVESSGARELKFGVTKKWKLTDLRKAEYNPRKITEVQKQELRASLAKFGVVEPMVVNVNPERWGVVVGGHQRLSIYGEEGVAEIDAVEVNLSLEDERELNLRLNKNVGGWDEKILLEHFEKDELKRVGFLDSELGFFDAADKVGFGDGLGAEPKYPIVQMVDEKYDAVVVFCKSSIDFLWLSEMLGLEKTESYKCKAVGQTRVIDVHQFRRCLKAGIQKGVDEKLRLLGIEMPSPLEKAPAAVSGEGESSSKTQRKRVRKN